MTRLRRPSGLARTSILWLSATVLALSSCSTAGTGPSSAPGDGSSGAAPSTGSPASSTVDTTPLDEFRSTTITVLAADGSRRTYCVLVADTEALRRQGLMYVEDPALGGHDGMVFLFDEDVDGGFWMKNTRLPLSIAYLAADGSLVSSADMEPCPAGVDPCPTYPPDGPYRSTIEVPRGGLPRLGISGGATVTIGQEPCSPAASPSGSSPR